MSSRTLCIAAIAEPSEVKLTIKQTPNFKAEVERSSDDVEMTEATMRRALGLGGPSARLTLSAKAAPPRQEFSGSAFPAPNRRKSDGGGGGNTPADVLSPLQQRATELEQQLATERQKHAEATQLLQRAEQAVRGMETRFQREAMAQQEELDGARQATVRAQRALDSALFEVQQCTEARRSARAAAQEQVNASSANQPPMIIADAKLDVVSAATPADLPSPPKKRGRPRTRPVPEPKPVRWWTPSFKAKAKS